MLSALVALTIKLIPTEVFDECRKDAENLWKNGEPKKWYYAISIILIGLFIILIIVKTIWF